MYKTEINLLEITIIYKAIKKGIYFESSLNFFTYIYIYYIWFINTFVYLFVIFSYYIFLLVWCFFCVYKRYITQSIPDKYLYSFALSFPCAIKLFLFYEIEKFLQLVKKEYRRAVRRNRKNALIVRMILSLIARILIS